MKYIHDGIFLVLLLIRIWRAS